MPSISDIYRFTIHSRVAGEDVYNVDFKVIETLPPNPLTDFELARSYHAKWQGSILAYLSNESEIVSVLAENLTDGVSFGQFDSNVLGAIANPTLPSFIALGVKLQRSTKITRNGYKRIAGIPENAVTLNSVVMAQAAQDEIEFMFGNTVVFEDQSNPGDDFNMGTVIVGRTLNGSGVYELDLAKINPVNIATISNTVTSQNSRKPGQ